MTTANALRGEPGPARRPVPLYRFLRIQGTGRREAALPAPPGRQREAIGAYHAQQQPLHSTDGAPDRAFEERTELGDKSILGFDPHAQGEHEIKARSAGGVTPEGFAGKPLEPVARDGRGNDAPRESDAEARDAGLARADMEYGERAAVLAGTAQERSERPALGEPMAPRIPLLPGDPRHRIG
jgi:hypothetical protein